MGKGAQGAVYLVEERETGEKYVLKKVTAAKRPLPLLLLPQWK